MKSKIPKHIVDIYVHALKKNQPLTKIMFNGVLNDFNYNKGRASSFISYYVVSEKHNEK